jgi:hypothetical protein
MEMEDLLEAVTSLLLGKALLIRVGQEAWCPRAGLNMAERNHYSSVTLPILL